MSTSRTEQQPPMARAVLTSKSTLSVELVDGRSISVPVEWYPRLAHGSEVERNNWRLVGNGVGIHWPDLDEDILIDGLLAGKKSGEGRQSLEQWLASRPDTK